MSIDQAREMYAKHLLIRMQEKNNTSGFVDILKNTLKPFCNGSCPVCIAYNKNNAQALLPLGEQWRINPCDELLIRLREILPDDCIEVCY